MAETLIYSAGRVALGIIAPFLIQNNIIFDLYTRKQRYYDSLAAGLQIITPSFSKRLHIPVHLDVDLPKYDQIIISVGFFALPEVISRIRKENTHAKIFIAENILADELPTDDNLSPLVVDRIVTSRNFSGDGCRVMCETGFQIIGNIIPNDLPSYNYVPDDALGCELNKKFLKVNLPHKLLATLAQRNNKRNLHHLIETHDLQDFYLIMKRIYEIKQFSSFCVDMDAFLSRINSSPIDSLGRISAGKGKTLFMERLNRLGLKEITEFFT